MKFFHRTHKKKEYKNSSSSSDQHIHSRAAIAIVTLIWRKWRVREKQLRRWATVQTYTLCPCTDANVDPCSQFILFGPKPTSFFHTQITPKLVLIYTHIFINEMRHFHGNFELIETGENEMKKADRTSGIKNQVTTSNKITPHQHT